MKVAKPMSDGRSRRLELTEHRGMNPPCADTALDLAQCAGMELDEHGKLQPCKPGTGEVESAIDPNDMQDLRPVGFRFLVCALPDARAGRRSLPN